ncbi:MAG: iron chelate uptake ABC transporter family permease subunit [Gemmatimonadetes bacterium]|nr:iron ABC transporter permease [Gemmatimonadota bacterium]NIQ57032.1 iron ABC transporter permease [Gemmatimonadota bacterium]NIU77204.1 iron chelate uptake ABC transporter family permease subunit [Gammaproteobacteria bacterium]NIX46496.1 iron chelate uptake ABC transporter family permease subunit [Gemmatimonadota bacterium]NIY10819.1 iron chelate uptake ABC transporter family permease subunit [Gemmatimonadota bacterium]
MTRGGSPLGPLLLLAAGLVLALLLAVGVGAVPVPPGGVIDALAGRADATTRTIVVDLRLPRAALAVLIGGALAVAGAVFQALLRNPLAEPYILGVSGGAAVAAVAVIGFAGAVAGWVVPVAAFAGGLGAILLVFRIAASVGSALDTRVLLLAGVVVGAFFNAVILLLLTLADVETFRSAVFWMMGSLAGATWGSVGLLAAYTVPALVGLLALARPLNLMAVGEETALYLGTRVERVKRAAYVVASLLVAAGVAAAGVIGFVGLIVPHALRLVWGGDHRFLLPGSALAGAAFLLLADTAARTVAAPVELPVGVVTALVGVPVFVVLLTRRSA